MGGWILCSTAESKRRERLSTFAALGVLLAYSCMAFPDALGVIASRLRLDGIASSLVFAWFALFAIPSGQTSASSKRGTASLVGVVEVARDVPTALAALSFAVGVIADVAFNLSVPNTVHQRFDMGDAAVGTVYAVLFGVKLPVTLLGAWLFGQSDARRLFPASIALAAAGAVALIVADGFFAYLAGVGLFAAGYANVYGFVFAVAAPRHPSDRAASVAALLTMSIAGGALASPLIAAMSCLGYRSAEVLSAAATAVLLLLAALAKRLSGRCA